MPLARSSSIASITAPYSTSSSALMMTMRSFLLFEHFLDPAAQVAVLNLDRVDEEPLVGRDGHDRLVLRLGLLGRVDGAGSVTGTPCCSSGATIIMMISSTSITSTSGVTLMSDLTPPLPPIALP